MGNVFSSIGQAIGSAGGLTNNIASGFTPQNTYQATSPLDVTALNGQIATSQGNLGQNMTQQQQLAAALLAQSKGAGPNPAQSMLNQATDQSIKQNTGMIASQKGINPALAMRQASENAAATSQQAAGQAATMQANQQLTDQQMAGSLYGTMANENLQDIGTSGQLADASALGADNINANVASGNAKADQSTASGLLNSSGGAIAGASNGGGAQGALGSLGPAAMSTGGTVPTHLTPVAKIYHPDFMNKKTTALKSKGGGVPGKAKVAGDSKKNDTVPTMLSPGEIVIPRSIVNSKNAEKMAADFVAEELRKRKGKDPHGDFKEALKAAIGSRKGK